MTLRKLMAPLVVSGILAWSTVAWGGPITAIVEEIKADGASVAFMDYLKAGRTIRLGKKGRLVLGYLNSCLREVIIGGTVTIGTEMSIIKGGRVRQERVECDGGRLLLTAEEASKSAVIVFRKGKRLKSNGSPQPSLRVYSLQPVIQVKARSVSVTVERLDLSASAITVKLRDGVADFVLQKLALKRGGLYRISSGGTSRVVRVDAYAVRGGPLISRLITL